MAQSAPPTVNISVAAGKMTLTGADALKAGPTRLAFKSVTTREREFSLVRLAPGVTAEELVKRANKIKDDLSPLYKLASFEAGAGLAPKGRYQTTIELKEGTYALADTTKKIVLGATFTVGAGPSGAVAPKPDATIRLKDYAFGMPSRLPRSGTYRFRNTGDDPHFALAIQLKKGVSTRKVLADLKKGKEDDSVAAGFSEPVGLVSPGTTNDVRYKFKRGRYVMVCFFGDKASKGRPHAMLGMEKGFTVK